MKSTPLIYIGFANIMCVDVCKRRFLIQILAFVTVFVYESGANLSDRDLYPYNSTYGDQQTENLDDGGSGLVELTTAFTYFNKDFQKVYVSIRILQF